MVKIRPRPLIALLILLILASIPSRASAHPADMYAQNQSIQLTHAGLQIDWKILPGPFLADAAWAAADSDQNGSITPAEARAWFAPFLSDLSIMLDSQSVDDIRVQSVHWPATVDALRTGDDAVEITLQMSWPAGLRAQHALEIHNAHLESNSLNWFSLAGQDGLTFGQPAQDNGRLVFDLFLPTSLSVGATGGSPAPAAAPLTTWTSGTPNLPNFTASFSKLAANLANPKSTSSSNSPLPSGDREASRSVAEGGPGLRETSTTSALTGLVKNVQLSPLFLLSAFLLSLALGSLHALTPGHGKALVGAYLVGSRGRTRDAVLLGGIVTITHTGSVLVLGLITLLASHYILPSVIIPWLELISGLLVIAFGINLLLQRRHELRSPHTGHEHSHIDGFTAKTPSRQTKSEIFVPWRLGVKDEHSADHSTASNAKSPSRQAKSNIFASWRLGGKQQNLVKHPATSSAKLQSRQYASKTFAPLRLRVKTGRLHHHQPHDPHFNQQSTIINHQSDTSNPKSKIVNRKSLLALGISGGLVPCPDAIAILLVAVALNRVPFGMLLIVSFSIGLAAVLIGIGIAMVRGVAALRESPLLSHSGRLARFGTYAPVISALVVMGLGGGLTLNAWNSFKFSSAISGPTGNVIASGAKQSPSGLLYIASDSSGHDQLFMLETPEAPASRTVQYTHESSGVTGYSVSPDAKLILYSVFNLDGGSSLWSLNADGSGRRLALDCPQSECNSSAWYPDGSKVAYERLENSADPAAIPRFSIWWLDLQSGKTQPVFEDASFPSAAPQFSPDGTWLSYISAASNTLVLYNLKEARTLSVPLGSQAAIPETWSPAGDALLFGDRAESGEPPPLHVKTYALASGHITDLGGTHGETDFAASWSPDGKWIAINRNVPGPGPAGSSNQVWLVRPDRTQAHVLLNETAASYSGLSWSPDGRFLLYSRYTLEYSAQSTGHFDVFSTDINTGQIELLVPGGDVARFLP